MNHMYKESYVQYQKAQQARKLNLLSSKTYFLVYYNINVVTLIVDDTVYAKLHKLGNLRAILLSYTLYELPNLKNLES